MTTTDSIIESNRGRNPDLLALKWAKMDASAFAFFRGSAPLFYHFWAKVSPAGSPKAWICGDAHAENMGSYRGANRVPYFDLNDFDECCLAPVDWDVGRALTGLLVLERPKEARVFLAAYAAALQGGKPAHIEPEVAEGLIAELLDRVQSRIRKEFLAKWVGHERLRIRPGHIYVLPRREKSAARRLFNAWARRQPDPEFYRVLDVCGRIAGTGSLGLRRYVVLVCGKRQPFILDMKEAAPDAPRSVLRVRQPRWATEAERVATVQRFMQYVPIARLSWMGTRAASFIVHQLQPIEDRIDIEDLSPDDYGEFVRQWAHLLASAHLRSGGWKGSADLDTLIAYGRSLKGDARRRLVAAARQAAREQRAAWAQFKAARPGKISASPP